MTNRNWRPSIARTIGLYLFATLFVSLSGAEAARFPRTPPIEVAFDAPDSSVELVATLEIPDASFVKSGKPPLVILLHQMGMTKENWGKFREDLLQEGLATFAMDLRGFGLSIFDLKAGRNRPPNTHYEGEQLKYPSDVAFLVDKAVEFHHDKFDTTRFAVIGAALGANTGLLYADYDSRVKYVAMISAGLEYSSLRIAPTLMKFGDRPVLFAYSDKDQYGVMTIDMLSDILPRKLDVFVSESIYSGNRLLNADLELQKRILDDLRRFVLK